MTNVAWILFAVLSVGYAPRCIAGLGESESSVLKDATALHGTHHLRESHAVYTTHEIQMGNGIAREYVNAQGTVFAVTWHGPQVDLGQLLASYFPSYSSAAAGHVPVQGHRKRLEVSSGDLTVVRTGTMRTSGGIAYVHSLLPSGVNVGSLP